MSWAYTKDKRTDDKVLEDFDLGKEAELEIFNKLTCTKYKIDTADEFKTINAYKPDCFLFNKETWIPTEIKYTKYELTYVEFKKNQADELNKIGGMFFVSTPTRFMTIMASEVVTLSITTGYCNKDCYILDNPIWREWK